MSKKYQVLKLIRVIEMLPILIWKFLKNNLSNKSIILRHFCIQKTCFGMRLTATIRVELIHANALWPRLFINHLKKKKRKRKKGLNPLHCKPLIHSVYMTVLYRIK